MPVRPFHVVRRDAARETFTTRAFPRVVALVACVVAFLAIIANPAAGQEPAAGVTPLSSWLASATVGAGRDDQRFVVLDGATPADAERLFPGMEIVTTQTALNDVTWESPSAVVFGPARASAATPRLVGKLLANGSEVVLLGSRTPPAGPWRWQPAPGGNGWLATYPLAGPARFVSPEVYDSVDLRPVGRPTRVRFHAVLVGCLVVLAFGAAASLPSDHRRAARYALLTGVGVTLAVVVWTMRAGSVIRDPVTVVVVSPGGLAQVDHWTFDRTPGPTDVQADPARVGYPVLRSHAHEALARLNVGADGLSYVVDRHLPMALLNRQVVTWVEPVEAVTPLPKELARLAALYEGPDVKLVGLVYRADTTTGPTIRLQRTAGATTEPGR